MQTRCATPLHHLIITLHITRDIYNLSAPTFPRIFEQLDAIRSTAAFLRVPKDHSFRLDMLPDEASDSRSEGALLIGADPDEKPVGALDACGERCTDAGSGADADAALIHC